MKKTAPLSASSTEKIVSRVLLEWPLPLNSDIALGSAMRSVIADGLSDLPLPGSGQTLERWRALAAVGAIDLSLAKLFEGHTDAIAILTELGGERAHGLWSVWASETPRKPLTFIRASGNQGKITGRKAWCSGAAVIDHAVISASTQDDQSVLVQVNLRHPGVCRMGGGWHAVGMAATKSESIDFYDVPATMIGKAGDYTSRPGFWQGAAGIAAVWFGGAVAVARVLASSGRSKSDPHAAAHLGAVDSALHGSKALLAETAQWIDAHPTQNASAAALRVRLNVEATANDVLQRAGRALGAAPLCTDAIHAQRCADLFVYLRQSHGERDFAALGEMTRNDFGSWQL